MALALVLISLALLVLDSGCFAKISPVPTPAPAASPGYHGPLASPPVSEHHPEKSPAPAPTSFNRPQDRDCGEISCSPPLTQTPIGSPCGCVFPIKVVIDVGVDSYVLFNLVQELEVEVAAGTYLKQSQVKIISAVTSPHDLSRTEVTLYLVPLGHKFDNTTALLIYDRFWEKKVPLNRLLFHEYEVINVEYPGFPSLSPPSPYSGFLASGPSEPGNDPNPSNVLPSSNDSQKMNARIISIIVLSSFILLFLCFGICIFLMKSAKCKCPASGLATSSTARRSGIRSIIPSNVASARTMSFHSYNATCPLSVRTFSLAELEKATDEFSANRKLGEGGSGCVYQGIMEDGRNIAVKLLKRVDQDNRDREFVSEVETLSQLHHRNLVKLIGICIEGRKRCLVYELVSNGSVESHLHGADKGKGPLDWDTRMKIALGSARALAYLHEDSNPRVIHRDFKASNILLEEDFTPKVSDFGLAREASEGSHVSTRIMGTFGYVAPEYAMTGHLLVKSDVYSYGVVLLELLSGRKPVQHMSAGGDGPENLVVWARPLLLTKEGLEQVADPYLKENCDFDKISRVAAVASLCVHGEPKQRPFMGEVVQALKLIDSNKEDTSWGDSNCTTIKGSSSFEFKDDFDPEINWWSLDSLVEIERAYSDSGYSIEKRKKRALYRTRGGASELGHRSI